MKKIRKVKGFGIYELNKREQEEHGFAYAAVHPETMSAYEGSGLTPSDTDVECETLEQAVSWAENY